tara:strand:+ start:501 stop:617 length:117 start_codon:yes stop_codon:yes gene_type:complete
MQEHNVLQHALNCNLINGLNRLRVGKVASAAHDSIYEK